MMNGDANPGQTVMNGVTAGAAPPSAKAVYEQRKQYGKLHVNSSEISQYNVEHLTTYSIDRKDGLATVDDGVRKLKLLDARGKVWTQEALMQVDEKAVKVFDQATQEELEHFPMTSVQYVQAREAEPYSIIALVVKESDQKVPDMHLFHSPMVPADIIGADIESALADYKDKKGRKTRPDTLRRTRERVQASVIPPPPMNPPPAPPSKDGNVRDKIETWSNLSQSNEFQTGQDYNVSPELLTLKISRDVQILNHALDDIELFVARIQKSAHAAQELSRRKSSGKVKSRKKGGDGMLTLRSKLPPQNTFIDLFRKFKFSFNLIAKLKSHVQNPNAIEIVHFLFKPLKMCIQSCGGYDIPRSVDSPLHTKDALDLLFNCLPTSEADILRNLGDFWTKTRQEFPEDYFFLPYVPTFRNGWEPPPILGENAVDEERAREFAAIVQNQADRVAETRRASESSEAFKQHVVMHVQRNQNINAPNQNNNAVSTNKMCRSMYDYPARNKSELSVRRDEMLDVLDDSKAWWRVRNNQGQVGFVPGNHMVLMSHARSSSSNGSESAYSATTASPPPQSPTIPAPPPAPKAPAAPQAPPPPSKIAPVPVSSRRKDQAPTQANGNAGKQAIYAQLRKPSTGNAKMEQLAEELKGRVNSSSAQSRNFSIPKKRGNAASLKITVESSKADVKQWLESLGFSPLTVDSLGVLTGAQLFTLTKEELKMVCEEDGARVYSQITVQKSYMKDQQSDQDELQRVLNLRKVKSETE